MALHFVLPRPSEIQEVLSQVKVRNKGWGFTKVEGQESTVHTDICGHGYYEYVEIQADASFLLHLCGIHLTTEVMRFLCENC